MITIGVFVGLLGALMHSVGYLFTRAFVQGGGSSRGLLWISHVIMGVVSLVILLCLPGIEHPPVLQYAYPVSVSMGAYLLAQLSLFQLLKEVSASRVSPLLGIKVVFAALLTVLFFRTGFTVLQWVSVGLCAVSALLLNESGGRLPLRAWAMLLCTVSLYALSDIHVKKTVVAVASTGRLAPIVGCLYSYVFAGVIGVVGLCVNGWPARRDWVRACPFALTWLLAMVCLYITFGMVGIVFGIILQSSRGILSIGLGVLVARLGWLHIEQRHDRWTILKQFAAAIVMTLAIALYVLSR
jgi:uncharacterized membrane protein